MILLRFRPSSIAFDAYWQGCFWCETGAVRGHPSRRKVGKSAAEGASATTDMSAYGLFIEDGREQHPSFPIEALQPHLFDRIIVVLTRDAGQQGRQVNALQMSGNGHQILARKIITATAQDFGE
ncbi:hypothetical protein [Bradyrhizobium sp.]|uniref:hypothetical protein n=1 Tax=Bradyrhizobium sp. TaxID=376 RepID=UPI003BB0EEAD